MGNTTSKPARTKERRSVILMPIYVYDCRDCIEQRVTVQRSINTPEDAPICAACGHRMVRVYDSPTITFKGTGWGKNA